LSLIQIDGVDLLTPQKFSVTLSDLDGETNRNAKGELVRDRIAVKRKLSLQYQPLTTAQISSVLSKITNVYFQCTFLDPLLGANYTGTFYVGDRTAPLYNTAQGLWESITMDFIEK
jgi:hypothetical protein